MREGTTDADLVRAAFPPGSVTGAPKVQALKVIADLEGSQREVYTGAIGFASPHAGLELNVAIRTLETRRRAGVAGLRRRDRRGLRPARGAAGGARQGRADRPRRSAPACPARRRPPPPPPRLPPWPRRPDPAAGLLETIAVRGGEPVDAAAHLARLAASARELYGDRAAARSRCRRAPPDGRLRVLLGPVGRRRASRRVAEPAAATEIALEPRALAGGLGPHKWLDRPQDPAWLVVDLDGSVLEAAWANVWMLAPDGALVTPPADGRILPGLTRARLLAAEHLPTREEPIPLAALAARAGDPPDLLDPARDPRRAAAARRPRPPARSRPACAKTPQSP